MMTIAYENLRGEIPGPSPVPLLGWLPWLIRFAFDPLASLESLRKRYGNLIKLGIGKYPAHHHIRP